MSEKIVAIHFGPKSDTAKHDEVIFRAYSGLIEGIQNQGHEAVVTRGADNYDFTEGVLQEHWQPQQDGGRLRTQKMGQIGLERVGAIRDLGKLLRPTLEHPVPILNNPETIKYDDSKLAAYTDILHGLQGITAPLEADVQDTFEGDLLVVKPDKGTGGKGVQIVRRAELNEVMDDLMQSAPNQLHVVQEFVDMTIPFPADIKGMDKEEAGLLETLKERKKELRVFSFYGKDGVRMIPIARMMKEGEETSDTWVFVDPDYIPPEVAQNTKLAFERLSEKTGSREIFGSADFMWGKTASNPDPRWHAGEINLWKPIVSRRKPEVGHRYDEALSGQLVRMAKSEKETV